MINDPGTFPEITPQVIASLNEKAGETAISCGYHAIEFLLWGQDFSHHGPGNRPVTDFTTHRHAERRKAYLLACCQLLEAQLLDLVVEWSPEGSDNFRHEFLTQDPRKSVWHSLYGMKTLAGLELSGERLLVAWDTQEQEDEHSCFSDTTHQDVVYDALGIQNVLLGQYLRTDGELMNGAGLNRVASILKPGSEQILERLTSEALHAAKAIPQPFDQAIRGDDEDEGRKAILRCVELLEDQAAVLSDLEQAILAEIRENPQ